MALSYGGETESNAENMPKIVAGLMIAVIIIFFILLAHFRRIATATLLLFSLLLTLFGTAVGILLQGVDFSLTSILGIVSLMGILVHNAIIMYDYAEELRSLTPNHSPIERGAESPSSNRAGRRESLAPLYGRGVGGEAIYHAAKR